MNPNCLKYSSQIVTKKMGFKPQHKDGFAKNAYITSQSWKTCNNESIGNYSIC